MKHDIFLSHSDKDRAIAEAMCRHLEAGGVRCWMASRDISSGEEWGSALLEAIEAAKILIVLFSSHSNTSKQVLREVERAVKNDCTILPVRLEDAQPSKSLEYFLSVTQWFDASAPPREQHWERLTSNVLRILGRSGVQLPSASHPSNLNEPATRGADLRYDLTITLKEAALGVTVTVTFPRLERCDSCKGEGYINDFSCVACKGTTRLERECMIKIKIPPGVDTGARLRLAGEGEAGVEGGTSGDLFVVLTVKKDPEFRREGADIFSEFVVPPILARSGGEAEIPTLWGNVKAQIPAGLASGQSLRLKAKGVPAIDGSGIGAHFVRILVKE